MTTIPRIVLVLVLVLVPAAAAAAALVACGGGGGPTATADAPSLDSDGIVTLPTWKLEDVQPASARVGQTYGLDTFAGKIISVTLVEGF